MHECFLHYFSTFFDTFQNFCLTILLLNSSSSTDLCELPVKKTGSIILKFVPYLHVICGILDLIKVILLWSLQFVVKIYLVWLGLVRTLFPKKS